MPNRLAGESSAYLLQHKDNPVDWQPWSEAPWEQARRESKPVLVSIGYSSCHWCHVMERESFENEEIARLMNEHLVCIKVEGPHTAPMYDPYSHLVFAARAADVRHVVIRGRIVVRNRELQTLDLDRIEAQTREFSESVRSN